MNDPGPLVPHHPPALRAVSFYHFVRRCGVLQISAEEVLGYTTIGQVQTVAKQRYRALARTYHPDHAAYGYRHHSVKGTTFRKITKTYTWLMALPATAPLPAPPTHALPPLPPRYEADLPWAFTARPVALPYGYQEVPGYRWA